MGIWRGVVLLAEVGHSALPPGRTYSAGTWPKLDGQNMADQMCKYSIIAIYSNIMSSLDPTCPNQSSGSWGTQMIDLD